MPITPEQAARARRIAQLKAVAPLAGLVLDDNEALFLDRELRAVEREVFRKEYPEFKHRDFLPQNQSVPRGATSLSYRMIEQIRRAVMVGNQNNTIPRVDAFATEWPTPIRPIATSYGYTVLELEAMQMAQRNGSPINLENERAIAARDSIEAEENRLAFFGDAPSGIPGAFNNENVTVVDATTDTNSETDWTNGKTVDGIIADVNLLKSTIRTATAGMYEPNFFGFPPELYGILSDTQYSQTGGSDRTVLEWLRMNNPGVSFESSQDLATANAAGTGARIVAYYKDPGVLDELNPVIYEQLPPQPNGFDFLIIAWGSHGGTRVRKPKAVCYLDGADA